MRDIQKPIGVSEHELTRALPDDLKSSLPTVKEIEAELSGDLLATRAWRRQGCGSCWKGGSG